MDVDLRFRSGARHAIEASRYFRSLAEQVVDDLLPDETARQVLMSCSGAPNIPMRVWSRSERLDELVCDMLPFLLDVLDRTTALRTGQRNDALVKDLAHSLSAPLADGGTIFLELLGPQGPFTPSEEVILVLMVLQGEVHFVSAPGVIYAELEPRLYGLAIAGVGSYQFNKPEFAMVPR